MKQRPVRPITPASFERAAVRYLERFPASRARFRQVMKRKLERVRRELGPDAAPGDDAIDVVERMMLGAGLLDDPAYARALAQSYTRRGFAKRAISQKLRQKGVQDEDASAAIAGLEGEDPDLEAAWELARRKKLGPYRGDDREERRKRDLAAFARRGFSYGVAQKILDADEPRETR